MAIQDKYLITIMAYQYHSDYFSYKRNSHHVFFLKHVDEIGGTQVGHIESPETIPTFFDPFQSLQPIARGFV